MRVCLAVLLLTVVLPGAQGASSVVRLPDPRDAMGWAIVALAEGLIGLVLGASAALVAAGARQAGELVGLQAGLAPASLVGADGATGLPGEGSEDGVTPLGSLYGWVALLVFLGLDGPLLLVDALVRSYTVIPAGLGWGAQSPLLSPTLASELFERVGGALQLAVQVGAPAWVSLLMAGLVLAVVTRLGAGQPLGGLTWPLRGVVGVALALVFAGVLAAAVGSAWRAWSLGH
jgi:flagellar biosynthetic protein FliR